jgi:hypothetical protein
MESLKIHVPNHQPALQLNKTRSSLGHPRNHSETTLLESVFRQRLARQLPMGEVATHQECDGIVTLCNLKLSQPKKDRKELFHWIYSR